MAENNDVAVTRTAASEVLAASTTARPDAKAQKFRHADEQHAQKIEYLKQLLELRKGYSGKIVLLAIGQAVALNTFLIFQGWHFENFSLDENLLKLYVGFTAAEVYGLVRIIVCHLFPKEKNVIEDLFEGMRSIASRNER